MVTGRKARQNHPLLATRDHVVPKAENGMNGYRNEVWACQACNNVKGDMSVGQWATFRNNTGEWWLLFEQQNLRGKRLYIAMFVHGGG
jgi:5-methylcytosine-specific restriction endonuclease McrA